MTEETIEKLDEAVQIVEKEFGKGAAESRPELVAAVLQSLALEGHASQLHAHLKEMTEWLCPAAAVAAGD